MDATRARCWAGALALTLIVGCFDSPPPSARQEQPEPRRERAYEPPQVVETELDPNAETADDEQPPEDASSGVIEWIQQVDDARIRAERRGWQVGDDRPRQVADQSLAPNPPGLTLIPTLEPASTELPPEDPPTTAPATLAPPRLNAVNVRSTASLRTAQQDPVAPGVNSAAVAHGAPMSLREFLERVPPPEDGSFRAQLDLRLLWIIAGEYDRARTPLQLVTAEQQEVATRFLNACIALRDGHMGSEAEAASAAARELAEAQAALRKLSDLRIPVIRLCSAVRNFGQYDTIEPATFPAGRPTEFVVYCEVTDFVSELRDDDHYHTLFDLTTTIFNAAGDILWEKQDAGLVDRCRNRRHDCFIPRLVQLPATLSPGHYVAKVTIADKLGHKVAQSQTEFELVARP